LDDVFERKDYGYDIINTLVTDIDPDIWKRDEPYQTQLWPWKTYCRIWSRKFKN
jgi:hypothetical protein